MGSEMCIRDRSKSTSKLQSTATEHATEDAFFLGDKDLEKIVALLLWMSQNFRTNIESDDIHDAALETIIGRNSDGSVDAAMGHTMGLTHAASVKKLSQLIDIMMLHKDGSSKDANATLEFMRRVAKIREEVLATASDNATERVELSEEDAVSYTHLTLPTNREV